MEVSELILKEKFGLHQLAGLAPAVIVIPFNNGKIVKLWEESKPWQRACSNILGEISNNYPKSKRIQHIKRTSWVLP